MVSCVFCGKRLMETKFYKIRAQNSLVMCKECYENKYKDAIPVVLLPSHRKDK